MLTRVLYHDHCFDGAASAAYFSRFIAGAVHPDAEFRYTGMAHKASQLFDPSLFDGDENAIVDFKYSSDPKLTWWFDHHQSAFLNAEDQDHFRRDTSGRKLYDAYCDRCHNPYSTRGRQGPGLKGVFKKAYLPVSGIPANDARVGEVIRIGRGKMEGYSNVLNQQQLEDLLAYLHTL